MKRTRIKGQRSDLLPPCQVWNLIHRDDVCVSCGRPADAQHAGLRCCEDAVCRAEVEQVASSRRVASTLRNRARI